MTGLIDQRLGREMPWGAHSVSLDVTSALSPVLDVLLLDNKDSFTFNLAHACAELGASVDVVDSDLVTATQIKDSRAAGLGPAVVVIGPGPRGPHDLPRLVALLRELDGEVPLFGVCLGLQALVLSRGGVVGRAAAAVHGKRDLVDHDGSGCFVGAANPLWVMRYHSLVATTLPSSFTVTARDAAGQVMAVRDATRFVEAVQFHPESIGTAGGLLLLQNVLRRAGVDVRDIPQRPGSVPPVDDVGPGYRAGAAPPVDR